MEPEARLLRYFLAIAEHMNFTRAAESLGIAQPALSAQIRQLEAQLGVKLLERTTRSVRLTEAGRAVKEQGPAALSALSAVWEEARRVGRGEAGRLRLAYSPSTGYDTAPRLVDALRSRLPQIEVLSEVMPSAELVRAVREGTVDVGVARTPATLGGVRLRTVRFERQGALLASGHPLAQRREVDLAALAEHAIVMHPREANPAHFDLVVALFRDAGLAPRVVERGVAFDPTQREIRAGRAIGIVGESSAEGLAEGLRWVPLSDVTARVEVMLVLRDGDLSPVADRFERIAIAHAAAHGWLRG